MENLWAAQWHSESKLDGERRHIIYDNFQPTLFRTRQECRWFIKRKYGYIANRPDLQAEPHGWRVPQAVKVKIVLAQSEPSKEKPDGEVKK